MTLIGRYGWMGGFVKDRYGWNRGFVKVDNVIRGGLRSLNNWSVVRG